MPREGERKGFALSFIRKKNNKTKMHFLLHNGFRVMKNCGNHPDSPLYSAVLNGLLRCGVHAAVGVITDFRLCLIWAYLTQLPVRFSWESRLPHPVSPFWSHIVYLYPKLPTQALGDPEAEPSHFKTQGQDPRDGPVVKVLALYT